MLAGFLAELCCAERRLAGNFLRQRARKPGFYACRRERVDIHLHKCARSAAERRKRGKLRLGNIIDRANGAEHCPHQFCLRGAAQAVRADGACRAKHLRADIGHYTNKRNIAQIGSVKIEALAGSNRYNERFRRDGGRNQGQHVRQHLRLDAEYQNVRLFCDLPCAFARDKPRFLRKPLRFFRRAVEAAERVGRKAAASCHAVDNRACHIAETNKAVDHRNTSRCLAEFHVRRREMKSKFIFSRDLCVGKYSL